MHKLKDDLDIFNLPDCFEQVNQLYQQLTGIYAGGMSEIRKLFAENATKVLCELDQQGLFGNEKQRNDVCLFINCIDPWSRSLSGTNRLLCATSKPWLEMDQTAGDRPATEIHTVLRHKLFISPTPIFGL